MKIKVLLLSIAVCAALNIVAQVPAPADTDSILPPSTEAVTPAPPVIPEAQQPPHQGDNRMLTSVILIVLLLAAVGGVLAMFHRQNTREINALRDEIDALRADADKANALIDENIKTLNAKIEATKQALQQKQSREAKPQAAKPTFAPCQFLSRADVNGVFGRAADHIEPGNSFYELNTTDGVHGTFHVIDAPDVHQLALMMPTQNITGACDGENIHTSAGMKRIVTDKEGTAVMKDGKWHITSKSLIHYEP